MKINKLLNERWSCYYQYKTKTNDSDIRQRWKEYFNELLNVENPSEMEELESVEGPLQDVMMEEVEITLKSMESNRAPDPSGLNSDILKSGGKVVLEQLTKVLQHIMDTEESPAEWKDSVTIPIFKGKGDPLQCGKYRGLRLLEHSLKVWEKILDRRLKTNVNVSSNQFGFPVGRSTTDATFILRQMQQKYVETKKMKL